MKTNRTYKPIYLSKENTNQLSCKQLKPLQFSKLSQMLDFEPFSKLKVSLNGARTFCFRNQVNCFEVLNFFGNLGVFYSKDNRQHRILSEQAVLTISALFQIWQRRNTWRKDLKDFTSLRYEPFRFLESPFKSRAFIYF